MPDAAGSPSTATPQHPREDGCYFCATDQELLAGLDGEAPRTLHMQLPVSACPFWDEENDRG
ncbi:MAG TPA: hypothetical protein VIQ30_04865 [Pseudonocardia sp.]